jgi:recombination protein RecT
LSNELQKDNQANRTLERVKSLEKEGNISLPKNYSAENALKSAWLILQGTVTRSKEPVLKVCTPDSIGQALFDMVLQALSPAKKQCYFIAYGNELSLSRSYFGSVAAAKNVNSDIKTINSQVIYRDDEFSYHINPETGMKAIDEHKQKITNISNDAIVGAYSVIIGKNDKILHTELMTYDQILTAWRQSYMNPVLNDGSLKQGSFHAKFTDQACLKTVIARACKMFINTSDDSTLMADAFNRTTEHEFRDVSPEINELPEKKSTISNQLPTLDEEEYSDDEAETAYEMLEDEYEEAEEFVDDDVLDSLFGNGK